MILLFNPLLLFKRLGACLRHACRVHLLASTNRRQSCPVTVVTLTSEKTGQTWIYGGTDLSQGCDCDSFYALAIRRMVEGH